MKEQIEADKALAKKICDLASGSILMQMGEDEEYYWDDSKGGWLDKELLMEARKKEMEYFRKMKVYEKVPRSQAYQAAGKAPIKVCWVDTNKGCATKPNYRSRLVAMEFKVGNRPELYSATPPLEVVRLIISLVASTSDGSTRADPTSIMHIDISRAYLHAPCLKPTFIEIPIEDQQPGDEGQAGKLNVSMYGTREAQINWENIYAEILTEAGLRRGIGTPCVLTHDKRGIRVVVHGYDFLASGKSSQLAWMK